MAHWSPSAAVASYQRFLTPSSVSLSASHVSGFSLAHALRSSLLSVTAASVVASQGAMNFPPAQVSDQPSPWRFVRWRKAEERQKPTVPATKSEQKKGNFVYKALPGEDLAAIAAKFNTYVEVLLEANNILSPQNVAAGQLMWVPLTYQIKWGDTLWSLSRRFGVKIETIQAANGIQDRNLIYAGDIVVVPDDPVDAYLMNGL
eukprot:TRINITY_DN121_c0_g1_i1.p1 TRINITY_DN121_c0_g1~~TRINITY_DN121_c0_g1_i1.p1  ORF type:complete len:203 (-),score=21.52 TRINITY_DN121_c0_g1_i1:384-992(-)